jgi:hypothetical protein
MWEMVAKEMGLPWRAIEAIHWQMGPDEMGQRANVPVFQAHNTQRSKSPPTSRTNAAVATPTTPNATNTDLHAQLHHTHPAPTRQRRSSSSSSRRRANSARQHERPALAPVSETEALPTAPTSDPTMGYKSEAAVTPGSSVEWNGSPTSKAIPEERVPPDIPHLRGQPHYPPDGPLQRSHSHHRTHSQTSIHSGEILARAEEKT